MRLGKKEQSKAAKGAVRLMALMLHIIALDPVIGGIFTSQRFIFISKYRWPLPFETNAGESLP